MSRAGLKKVSKSVKGKNGTVRRSYWVKAQEIGSQATRVALKEERVKPSMIARLFNRGKTNVLHSFNHSGPNSGSDHSSFALLVGDKKNYYKAIAERGSGSQYQADYYAAISRRSLGRSLNDAVNAGGRWTKNPQNRGYSHAVNHGFGRAATGEITAAIHGYPEDSWVAPRRAWDR